MLCRWGRAARNEDGGLFGGVAGSGRGGSCATGAPFVCLVAPEKGRLRALFRIRIHGLGGRDVVRIGEDAHLAGGDGSISACYLRRECIHLELVARRLVKASRLGFHWRRETCGVGSPILDRPPHRHSEACSGPPGRSLSRWPVACLTAAHAHRAR